MTYLLTNCRIYTGDALLVEHDVLVQGPTIQAITPGRNDPHRSPKSMGRG